VSNNSTSEKLKTIYKIFTAIFSVSLVASIANILIEAFWIESPYVLSFVFGGIIYFFGSVSGLGIVPLFIMVTLVLVSTIFAIKEKNHKNIMNIKLLKTLTVITVSAFLQNIMLIEMV